MKKCPACLAFFDRFRCNSPDECDCPRCQGYCLCEHEKENIDRLGPDYRLPEQYYSDLAHEKRRRHMRGED